MGEAFFVSEPEPVARRNIISQYELEEYAVLIRHAWPVRRKLVRAYLDGAEVEDGALAIDPACKLDATPLVIRRDGGTIEAPPPPSARASRLTEYGCSGVNRSAGSGERLPEGEIRAQCVAALAWSQYRRHREKLLQKGTFASRIWLLREWLIVHESSFLVLAAIWLLRHGLHSMSADTINFAISMCLDHATA